MNQPMAGDFTVVSVDRQEVFAGKLGRRVSETLVAEKDGVRYEIKLGRSHTAIHHYSKGYSAGDTVKVDGFAWGTVIKKLG